jgi:hypothetical protein
LIRADTPAKEALDEATKIKKKFDESVKKMAQYKAYLEVLDLPATPIPEIEEFETKFVIRQRIWEIRLQFEENKKKWYYENFREQEAADIV